MTPMYANYINIQSSDDSVLIQFGVKAGPNPMPVAQLMVTPKMLKQIEGAIHSAVVKHERQHGPISDGSIHLATPDLKV